MNRRKITRKRFLGLLCGSAATLTVAGLFRGCAKTSSVTDPGNPPSQTNGTELTLDTTTQTYAALESAGGAAYVTAQGQSKPLIVHRISESQVAAFSSNCPHQHCQVDLPQSGAVICPCHGSRFDGSGNLVSGPASTGLRAFSARIEAQRIIISLS